MSPILAALLCFCLYLIGFKFYGKYLGRRIFQAGSEGHHTRP